MGPQYLMETFFPELKKSTKNIVFFVVITICILGFFYWGIIMLISGLYKSETTTSLEKSGDVASLRLPEIQENNIESQKKMAGLSQPDYQSIKLVARIAGMNSFIEVGEPTRVEDGYFLKIRVPGYDGCGVTVYKEPAPIDRSPGWVATGVACSVSTMKKPGPSQSGNCVDHPVLIRHATN